MPASGSSFLRGITQGLFNSPRFPFVGIASENKPDLSELAVRLFIFHANFLYSAHHLFPGSLLGKGN